MSAAHDAHADASAGHHDAHDHFDNEPATELGADEPRTPNWIPYLGLALFFSAGVACLLCSEDKPADEKAAAVAVEAAPAPQPPPQAVPQLPPQLAPMRPGQPAMPVPVQPVQPGQPGQPGQPPNGLRQLSPEQARELQRLIEQRQGGGGVPQPGAVPQPAVPQPVRQPPPQDQPAHL